MAVSLAQATLHNHHQIRVKLRGTPTEFGTLLGDSEGFAAAVWALVSAMATANGVDATEFAAVVADAAPFWSNANEIELLLPTK